ncbi:MAG: hypothetical protein MR832_04125 [Clostridiales bacterium]|nr:hypothetical protein [Clostridiales bacterium]
MQAFKDAVRAAAEAALADLVGFAARDRFDGLPAAKNPFTLFPEAKTAIVIGRRVTRGSLRGVEEGVNFGDYGSFGKSWLADEFLTETLYTTAQEIERAGFDAMPLTPGPHPGADGAEPCDPDFGYAAVAAGLGELGLSGEVLTPRFGPRQRFAILLTDAACESDPLCEKSVCTRCGRCAAICPLHAMGPETVDVCVAGKTMPVYERRARACASCPNGAVSLPYLQTVMRGSVREECPGVDRLAAVCGRTCVAALEDADVLENKFDLKFRQREVWRKDGNGRILPPVPADKA